jgi:group II intron reverse transcriptase/maturase
MRSIMDAYYDPQFSPNSHGFREGKGCKTALKDIYCSWTGTKWFIEGDIKGCFDNIEHSILLDTLRDKIQDGRFLNLINNLLTAGYLEQWNYRPTLSGTPQGGIISPLLANIYMDRLDKFVEMTLVPEFTRGQEKRRKTKEYQRLGNAISRFPKDGPVEKLIALKREKKKTRCRDPFDPEYRRLRYIRYADDFLLGFAGPKDEAEEIKNRIGTFLRDQLKLELSPEKTLITHAGTEQARFLGYGITVPDGPHFHGGIKLRIPIQKLESKVAEYMRDGKAIHRAQLLSESDFDIVARYGSEYRGIVEYYALAENRFWLHRLRRVVELSMLKTLAGKHKSSVVKMARKYRSMVNDRGKMMRCYEVIIERPGKNPLVARCLGMRLQKQPHLDVIDGLTFPTHYFNIRSELIDRLLADQCEVCGSTENVEVHHIRKLADLKVKGRREVPLWKQRMASRRRKTEVLCEKCHDAIHRGDNPRGRRNDADGKNR